MIREKVQNRNAASVRRRRFGFVFSQIRAFVARVRSSETSAAGRASRLPLPRDLGAAFGMLTPLPFERQDIRRSDTAPAMLFFPVVGGLIGLVLMAGNLVIATHLSPLVGAVVLVALWEAVSAGPAVRAYQPAATAGAQIARRGDGARETTTLTRLLLVAILVAKVTLLAIYVTGRPAALLFAPLLARWAMVVLAVGVRDAAAPSRKLNASITFREFALTSVLTCAVVFTVADAFGILLVVGVAALTLVLRLWYHHRSRGADWRRLLASAELVELLVVAIAGAVGGR